jgi:hypothetical protein
MILKASRAYCSLEIGPYDGRMGVRGVGTDVGGPALDEDVDSRYEA